jgi:hypothetical protein
MGIVTHVSCGAFGVVLTNFLAAPPLRIAYVGIAMQDQCRLLGAGPITGAPGRRKVESKDAALALLLAESTDAATATFEDGPKLGRDLERWPLFALRG